MKFRRWLLVIVCCLGIAAGLAWTKYSQIQQAMEMARSFPEPMQTVEFAISEVSSWQPEVDVSAEVLATRSIELRNELSGRVVEVGFRPGETVLRGQVLLRQDTSQESARLAAAVADAELAAVEYERVQKLLDMDVASESQRDQTLARKNASVAEQRALQSIIDKKNIIAPFDAITGLHELEVGQYLDIGTLISRLVGVSDKIWIDFSLPQNQAPLEIGDKITIAAPGAVGDSIDATIIGRDAWVDTRSRNIKFRARADNSDGRLTPGLSVTAIVPVGETRSAVLVPSTAVRYDLIGTHVYTLEPIESGDRGTDRAHRRAVEVGAERDRKIVIISGLDPGQRVAANGSFKLREGVLVNAVVAPRAPETTLLN
jgi:membrane fusion protein (multidrug efflux system)